LEFLYEYETWSLTLRREETLRVLKNRVLRRLFGPKRDGKFHNQEFNNSKYCSPYILRGIELGRMKREVCVARMGRSEMHENSLPKNLKRRDHLREI
jgi:hypothetical protein